MERLKFLKIYCKMFRKKSYGRVEGTRAKRRFVGGEIYSVTECLCSAKNDHVKGEAEIQDGGKDLAEFVPRGAKR